MPARLIRILLTLALLILVYSQFRTLNGLNAGTALLVVMGSIKLLETRTRRDRAIVVATALFLLLAAMLDRQSLLRAPLYLAHTWLCCTALAFNAHDGNGMSSRGALRTGRPQPSVRDAACRPAVRVLSPRRRGVLGPAADSRSSRPVWARP